MFMYDDVACDLRIVTSDVQPWDVRLVTCDLLLGSSITLINDKVLLH